jgi:hypothetical protein
MSRGQNDIFGELSPNATKCYRGDQMAIQLEIETQINLLRVEHRDMDSAIAALLAEGSSDQLQIARLKKCKLVLRDQIIALESALIPDSIA